MIIEISKNVHTLNRLEMRWLNESFESGIETLILSQKHLKEIAFMFISEQFPFNKKIIDHLSQSLRTLEFNGHICLPVRTISSFINLTELKIYLNSFYLEDSVKSLKEIFLPNLEILSLINIREEDLSTWTKLIENTKGSLRT